MCENEKGLICSDEPVTEEEEEKNYDECGEEDRNDGGEPCGGMCAGDDTGDVENDSVAGGTSGDASGASLREKAAKEKAAEALKIGEDARRRAHDEVRELFELFPNVSFSELPASVRESDLPLAAAYALYERRERRLSERAESANDENRARSAGRVSDGEESFYTPEEVRRMTPMEVRADYDAILRSMKKWK